MARTTEDKRKVDREPAKLVRRLLELFEARAWSEAAKLLAEGFEAWWPHTGERFVGRDAFVGMNRAYPEGWHIRVLQVLAQGNRVATSIRVDHGNHTFYAASFFDILNDRISRAEEYWVEAGAERPPAWRARFASRA
jgi:hypothetical protein